MTTSLYPAFPRELEELIIKAIPSNSRKTLLVCALVCRTWAFISRRELHSACFPDGTVKLEPNGEDIDNLLCIFKSPLCTLKPNFVRTLHVTRWKDEKQTCGPHWDSFLESLPKLDTVSISLEGIRFDGVDIDPSDEAWSRFVSTSTPTLSTVQRLSFISRPFTQFEFIARMICLCPALKEVEALGERYEPIPEEIHPPLHLPPPHLHKLDINMGTLAEMADFLVSFEPPCSSISSLTVRDFEWDPDDGGEFEWLLGHIGDSLEELDLYFDLSVYDGCYGYNRFEAIEPLPDEEPSDGFSRNPSLKRLRVVTGLDMVVSLLPHLFRNPRFAPKLEILEAFLCRWSNRQADSIRVIAPLDEYISSRPSLRQVVISNPGYPDDEWDIIEDPLKKFLPRCNYEGIVRFVNGSGVMKGI